MMSARKLLTASSLAFVLSVPALTSSASAQHVEYFASGPVNEKLAAQNTDVAVTSTVADHVQSVFVSGEFEKTYEPYFNTGVMTAIRAAYAQHLFEPIWEEDAIEKLAGLADYLEENAVGLTPQQEGQLKAAQMRRLDDDAASKAIADIELTLLWVSAAARLNNELLNTGEADQSVVDAPVRSNLSVDVMQAGSGDPIETLKSYEPDHPQYQGLKTARLQYQSYVDEGGWQAIPDGETLELGQVDPRVPALRQRLALEGYYSFPDITALFEQMQAELISADEETPQTKEAAKAFVESWIITYNSTLENALKRFQSRQGIEPDGVLGPRTLAALNESAEAKLVRIEHAMDQWRQQSNLGERHVWANIPSYTVEGWEDGTREIAMKSIVGLPSRKTPVFSDEIEYAVTNPRWYAPASIVRKDKLPKLQADASYAARNGYQIYDRATGEQVSATTVNWSDPSAADQFRMVQSPGANNALGELKIIFPNQHAVYLHGTPSKYLFERAERALSSGCVRLEDPVSMAKWIADEEFIETADAIGSAVEAGTRLRVDYDRKVPVHLTYITVTMGDDGQVNFWRDIYNREANLQPKLEIADLFTPPEPAQFPEETGNTDLASLDDQPQRAG